MNQLLLIVAITVAAAGGARAEPAESTPAAKLSLARRLYDEGVDAVNQGRLSVAFDRFKASYELAPRVQTLYNLAGAESQTGRLIEAAESYRRFLRETTDGRYPEYRTVAANQLELLEKQIAKVTLDITNIDPGDAIAIDEIELPHVVLHEGIPLNPGLHVARVSRGAQVIATRTLVLAAGVAESVRIELPTRPLDLELHHSAAPSATPPAALPTVSGTARVDHGSRRAWLRSPWLWSGVAAVVAGGAAGAYLLTRPDGVVVH
jgi:tetratricopeptide (TPR) repeat protein